MSRPVTLLDDDDDFRIALAEGVIALGYPARHFARDEALFAFIDDASPLCLLLDYHLADSNGLVVQARLAETRPDVPVIFVSACVDARVASAALSSGAIAFLRKPVRLAEIERLLAEIGEPGL